MSPVVADPDEPLVTVDDLVDHMSGISLTDGQTRSAERVLSGLQRGLERDLNRSFGVQAVTELQQAAHDGVVTLTRKPVMSVASVTVDDATSSITGQLVPTSVRPWGRGVLVGEGLAGLWFSVSYLGGSPLASIPTGDVDDVRLAILEKASHIMTNRHDDAVSVKDLTTRDQSVTAKSMHWTREEILHLDRLRRRVIAR